VIKPIECENVSKYTVIWKVCIVLVKISGNFPEISGKIGINFRIPEIFRRKFL